jgi:hypothetical protein
MDDSLLLMVDSQQWEADRPRSPAEYLLPQLLHNNRPVPAVKLLKMGDKPLRAVNKLPWMVDRLLPKPMRARDGRHRKLHLHEADRLLKTAERPLNKEDEVLNMNASLPSPYLHKPISA